jgi:hypothetical protein
MTIAIIGDSFSYNNKGWPEQLEQQVHNKSQNGVGEYKIYKQYNKDTECDRTIVCHTSPWRIHTPYNPVHSDKEERPQNDFLLKDVDYHSKYNKEMMDVKRYWYKYYDPTYQLDLYKLIVEKLFTIPNSIHITFHHPDDTKIITNNFYDVSQSHPGNINHLSDQGNQIVSERIRKLL